MTNNCQTPKTIEPNNLPSGVSTNYNDVKRDDIFMAMKLNSSNLVEHAYACGIWDNTPFCIEGTYDANPDKTKIQQANYDVVPLVFGNSCSAIVIDRCYNSYMVFNGNDLWGLPGKYFYGTTMINCRIEASGSFSCFED